MYNPNSHKHISELIAVPFEVGGGGYLIFFLRMKEVPGNVSKSL